MILLWKWESMCELCSYMCNRFWRFISINTCLAGAHVFAKELSGIPWEIIHLFFSSGMWYHAGCCTMQIEWVLKLLRPGNLFSSRTNLFMNFSSGQPWCFIDSEIVPADLLTLHMVTVLIELWDYFLITVMIATVAINTVYFPTWGMQQQNFKDSRKKKLMIYLGSVLESLCDFSDLDHFIILYGGCAC